LRDKLHAQFGRNLRREIADSRRRPFADGSPPIENEIPSIDRFAGRELGPLAVVSFS
jgi:hypothetical protein